MASNPFRPYPKGHGFVKLLLYGDPGTLKTRRALLMPGPRYRPSEVSTETRHTMLAWAQSNQGREALGLRPIVGGAT